MSDIQSVKRAFSILKAIAAYPRGVGLGKIAEQVDLPKSTVSRMLSTLESIDAVERMPYGKGFRLGPATLNLALQPSYLITIARPYLQELAHATNEAVNLCLPDGKQVHYVDQVQRQRNVQVGDWTGTRTSVLHVISPGKIFLAYWPPEQLETYLNRPLEQFTKHSITAPETLHRHLAQIKQQGYAWSYEEFELGLVGASAPIQNKDGQVVAAVNLSGPAFRFPPANQEDKIAALAVDTGYKISKLIKGLP